MISLINELGLVQIIINIPLEGEKYESANVFRQERNPSFARAVTDVHKEYNLIMYVSSSS